HLYKSIAVNAAAFWLKNQTYQIILAGFIAHSLKHAQQQSPGLLLFVAKRAATLTQPWIGFFFDFFQHLLRRGIRRQFVHHQLPLSTCHLLETPARPNLDGPSALLVDALNILGRGDDLSPARKVWA